MSRYRFDGHTGIGCINIFCVIGWRRLSEYYYVSLCRNTVVAVSGVVLHAFERILSRELGDWERVDMNVPRLSPIIFLHALV